MTFTLEDAARATGGQAHNPQRAPHALAIVTDTRVLRPGDAFLALRGENFDGHDFVDEAVAKGAAALVVEKPPTRNTTAYVVVADTRRAYMDLAAAARANFSGRVIAITGSSGKTTTKHLLSQLLEAHFGSAAVLSSHANENNEIGVSKLLLSAQPVHRVLVIEMGARHAGEIAELVEIALPHIGVLTNIGDAHLEIFGSRERLAETKWGLFSRAADAVLNANDEISKIRASSLQSAPWWFGEGEPSGPGAWIVNERTLLIRRNGGQARFSIAVPFPGAHNRANLAAAVAAALLLDVPAAFIAEQIEMLSLPAGRYQSIAFERGPRVIYDAYNANAGGTIASLNAFASENAHRRIAVLSSMAELGPDAPALHERVGAHAANLKLDYLLVGGDFGASLAAGAASAGFPRERIVPFASNAEAAQWLRMQTTERDVVLLKGSRKYRMEEIVEAFRGGA